MFSQDDEVHDTHMEHWRELLPWVLLILLALENKMTSD